MVTIVAPLATRLLRYPDPPPFSPLLRSLVSTLRSGRWRDRVRGTFDTSLRPRTHQALVSAAKVKMRQQGLPALAAPVASRVLRVQQIRGKAGLGTQGVDVH